MIGKMDPTSRNPLLGPSRKQLPGRRTPRPRQHQLPSTTLGGVCGWLEPPPQMPARRSSWLLGACPGQPGPLSCFTPPCCGNDTTGRALRRWAVPPGYVQHEDGDVVVLLVSGEHPVEE